MEMVTLLHVHTSQAGAPKKIQGRRAQGLPAPVRETVPYVSRKSMRLRCLLIAGVLGAALSGCSSTANLVVPENSRAERTVRYVNPGDKISKARIRYEGQSDGQVKGTEHFLIEKNKVLCLNLSYKAKSVYSLRVVGFNENTVTGSILAKPLDYEKIAALPEITYESSGKKPAWVENYFIAEKIYHDKEYADKKRQPDVFFNDFFSRCMQSGYESFIENG